MAGRDNSKAYGVRIINMQSNGPDSAEVEQVRSYLFAQTQKYSWDNLWYSYDFISIFDCYF